jgi:DNA-binding SARP family transcriptional activator
VTRFDDHRPAAIEAAAPTRAGIELRLLGGFHLSVDGRRVELPVSAQRLVAYVALAAPGRVARAQAAGDLWPDAGEERAAGNLRSALWRVKKACAEVVDGDASTLHLDDGVWLDIADPGRGLVHCEGGRRPARTVPALLPGWYDEWAVHERERVRQDSLHALEAACRTLIDAGDLPTAIDLALRAVASEPLRETPRRLAIEAHLAEGNPSEAVREYRRFAELLDDELGVPPSDDLQTTIETVTSRATTDAKISPSGADVTER